MEQEVGRERPAAPEKNKTLTMVIYALQALGFLVGVSWIVAVVINYVKKEEVAGTWLESHSAGRHARSGTACYGACSAPSCSWYLNDNKPLPT